MKCANCPSEASYEYRVTEKNSVFYCGKDLPKFLEERKKAGLLKITPVFTEDLKTVLETLEAPKTEDVLPPKTEPKPKKKAAKKSEE